MVVICLVSLDYTIYVLGVFAIKISRLIGTCICLLLTVRHNTGQHKTCAHFQGKPQKAAFDPKLW